MKQVTTIVLVSFLTTTSNSFTHIPTTFSPVRSLSYLQSSNGEAVPSDVELSVQKSSSSSSSQLAVDPTTLRNELLYTANTLTEESPTGIFLTTPTAMDKFTKAASRLEAITPSMTQREKELLVGDWVLLATSRSLKSTNVKVPPEMKKLPFKFKAPKLSDSLRNSITVLQRIRSDSDESSEIDRIDNVIQYTPLSLSDFIPENSPLGAIRNWNVNPLEVSESKITLVHDANVESVEPTLRTKLGLKSVVVSVAGKSQYLEANGADILGLNVPSLGDFANGGSFDSTYVDENVRISRGTIGFLDEVRLFVRKGFNIVETNTVIEEGEVAVDVIETATDVGVGDNVTFSEERADQNSTLFEETVEDNGIDENYDKLDISEDNDDSDVSSPDEQGPYNSDDVVTTDKGDDITDVQQISSDANEKDLQMKELENMSMKKLKSKLKSAGLQTNGKKSDLIQRLIDSE